VIICSCAVISDREIEEALVEILSQPNAPLPTPGVVYRHLSKKMACCSCAPLAVSTIYALVEKLEREGRVSPDACATAKVRLVRLNKRRRELNLPRTALIAAE
jgi:bacterioferritin-associated ferredoxin